MSFTIVLDKKGKISTAILEIKYRRIRIHPPIGKQNKYPELRLMVIHAEKPKNRDRITWKLTTNLLRATSTKLTTIFADIFYFFIKLTEAS